MPTYQYECMKCGLQFDIIQSMKDSALEICPKEKCNQKRWGRGKVRREVGTGAGLIFKGSGFYTTDYRSENYKSGAKKESESPGGAAKTEGKKTEGPAPTTPNPPQKSAAKKSET